VQDVLLGHPRVAAVDVRVAPDPDHHLIAHVVGADHASTRHVAAWARVFDACAGTRAGPEDFDTGPWVSSYDGGPIPEHEMREWVEGTVGRLAPLRPRRLLDVGCGTGLLLWRLAPGADRYLGLDASSSTVEVLRERVRAANIGAEVLVGQADDMSRCEPGAFDTVVMNSVTQYFPSVAYLQGVLRQAVAVVTRPGRVFVGDVRSLPLLLSHHLDVALARSREDETGRVVLERAARRVRQEPELVVHPWLFAALAGDVAGVTHVEVWPRRGRRHNELTRYRYDVMVHVGDPTPRIEPTTWGRWGTDVRSVAELGEFVAGADGPVAVADIPNARNAVAAHDVEPDVTVATLRARAVERSAAAVDPEAVHRAIEARGWEPRLSWARARATGSYDLVALPPGCEGLPVLFPASPTDRLGHEPVPGPGPGRRAELEDELGRHLLRALGSDHRVSVLVHDVRPVLDTGGPS